MGIIKQLEEMANEFCDHYCRFPGEYLDKYGEGDEADDKLFTERCDNCPLMKI